MISPQVAVHDLTSELKAVRLDHGLLVQSLERAQTANDLLLWERDMFLGMYVKLVVKVRVKRGVKKED